MASYEVCSTGMQSLHASGTHVQLYSARGQLRLFGVPAQTCMVSAACRLLSFL